MMYKTCGDPGQGLMEYCEQKMAGSWNLGLGCQKALILGLD